MGGGSKDTWVVDTDVSSPARPDTQSPGVRSTTGRTQSQNGSNQTQEAP